jgi:predicted 3-demethylubiquinone-9 3-methyltransferase (glyoxalase superfamily)
MRHSSLKGADMQKITPFLWFDKEAEEAANFYVSVFDNSKIVSVGRYGEAGPGHKGTVMSVTFELEGQSFYALSGGPLYKFTPAISLFVSCETQGEVDALWAKLCDGGRPNRCGWLTDRYGLSWQIIPSVSSYKAGTERSRTGRCRPCSPWTSSTSAACRMPSTGNRAPLAPSTGNAPVHRNLRVRRNTARDLHVTAR